MAWGTSPSRATLTPVSVWTTAHRVASGTFEDPQNARIIYLAVGGLLLLAVLLGVGTWWWWRNAKVEHPVLAPLEVMSTRKFEKSDFTEQRRQLDDVRLPGADLDEGVSPRAEPVDLGLVLEREDPPHFDDLVEPPAAQESAVEQQSVEQQSVEEPAVEELAVAELAVEEPAVEEPAVEEPAVEEPVTPDEAVVEPVGETSGPMSEVAPVEVAAPQPVAAQEVAAVASSVQLAMPIVVIDTSPAPALVLNVEPVEPEEITLADDTPSHFDPLLRPRID